MQRGDLITTRTAGDQRNVLVAGADDAVALHAGIQLGLVGIGSQAIRQWHQHAQVGQLRSSETERAEMHVARDGVADMERPVVGLPGLSQRHFLRGQPVVAGAARGTRAHVENQRVGPDP